MILKTFFLAVNVLDVFLAFYEPYYFGMFNGLFLGPLYFVCFIYFFLVERKNSAKEFRKISLLSFSFSLLILIFGLFLFSLKS